jgi:site-specific recombinase XerD
MRNRLKLQSNPLLSSSGEQALARCEQVLREQEDLTAAFVCNYLSDVRHFGTWYKQREGGGAANTLDVSGIHPHAVSTPALTCYCVYLQTERRQKPTSVNRFLIGLICSFGWVTQHHFITYAPSVAVTLLGQEESAPCHLDDQGEQALVATVTKAGNLRDRTLIVFLYSGTRSDFLQTVETIALT